MIMTIIIIIISLFRHVLLSFQPFLFPRDFSHETTAILNLRVCARRPNKLFRYYRCYLQACTYPYVLEIYYT